MTMNIEELLTKFVNEAKYEEWAAEAHEEWRKTKLEQGWACGPERDSGKKTNPFLVPFEELPASHKGLNCVTPYAVLNWLLKEWYRIPIDDFLDTLDMLIEDKLPNASWNISEYVHSHFIAAQLAMGANAAIRDDLVTFDSLDEETQSWDTNMAIAVLKQIKKAIRAER